MYKIRIISKNLKKKFYFKEFKEGKTDIIISTGRGKEFKDKREALKTIKELKSLKKTYFYEIEEVR